MHSVRRNSGIENNVFYANEAKKESWKCLRHIFLYFRLFPIFGQSTSIMSKSDNDWKKRLGTVYSTNPDFRYEMEGGGEQDTLPTTEQKLKIRLDKNKRKGKTVSLITGFIGKDEDLQELAALLKKKCGTGGSAKDGEIIIQGDFRQRLLDILSSEGYRAKII